MPREFKNLVMTNIRRIAHSPAEAECLARLLLMQLVLVCVAQAAQKTWYAGRSARDPDVDTMPAGGSAPCPDGLVPGGEDLPDNPGLPVRALWECITGGDVRYHSRPAWSVFVADTGLRRR